VGLPATRPSERSRGVALALSVVLGVFGAHRFYVGKVGTGLLQLCTFGGLGIWYCYDVILIAAGAFHDVDGRPLVEWGPEAHQSGVSAEVLDELDALRADLNDMSERLEFTERLLTRETLAQDRPETTGFDTPREITPR